jgi:hypothetical protein
MADPWTPKLVDRVASLHRLGASVPAIAATVGRSQASIRCKLHRMGLRHIKPPRPSMKALRRYPLDVLADHLRAQGFVVTEPAAQSQRVDL